MKVLWITNILMPDICNYLNIRVPAYGGWMQSSLEYIKEQPDLKIAVATPYSGENFISQEIHGVIYYLLPLKGRDKTKYQKTLEKYFIDIKNSFKPDVIHVHGSEFPFGLAYYRACGNEGLVVSMQGLISVISRYYLLDRDDSCHLNTFRDFIRGGLKHAKKSFTKRGEYEIELLKNTKFHIGRTEWDKSHSWALNPTVKYFFVGETLRPSFYLSKWQYSKCKPHSIFVSQASYPIKGFHKLLKALPIILKIYPDTVVNIAGEDPTKQPWYRIDSYGKYLKRLIKKLNVNSHVNFLGLLTEEQMCHQYLMSNVFVCCSAIENSPNSLGEAQTLGIPYVASYVGGIPEIVSMQNTVLYRYDEYEMLAKRIIDIFEQGKKIKPISFNSLRYEPEYNRECLVNAYKEIIKYQNKLP